MTKTLELGQRIYDASWMVRSKGTIVARRIGDDLQVLAGLETNQDVLRAAEIYLEHLYERIAITDDGDVYFTWDDDEDVMEIND